MVHLQRRWLLLSRDGEERFSSASYRAAIVRSREKIAALAAPSRSRFRNTLETTSISFGTARVSKRPAIFSRLLRERSPLHAAAAAETIHPGRGLHSLGVAGLAGITRLDLH